MRYICVRAGERANTHPASPVRRRHRRQALAIQDGHDAAVVVLLGAQHVSTGGERDAQQTTHPFCSLTLIPYPIHDRRKSAPRDYPALEKLARQHGHETTARIVAGFAPREAATRVIEIGNGNEGEPRPGPS